MTDGPATASSPAEVPVWFYSFPVGRIGVAPDGALFFRYDDTWLATEGAFPLSCTMPKSTDVYGTDVISPWIANLLPEEDQLRILTRSLGLDQSDSLAVLQEIGGDTAGALSFGPLEPDRTPGHIRLTDFYGVDDPDAALALHIDDLSRRPFLAGEDGVRQSLAGGQKKTALAVLDAQGLPVYRMPGAGDQLAIPRNGAPSTVILKPDNPNLPGIVENEVFCLRLAAAIGIRAAETTVITAGSRSALCSLRYDRRMTRGRGIIRVHQEDFAQANGLPPGRKYERGTIPGLSLGGILDTARILPPTDALALIDQVIFNMLVANTDAHAKNYSILFPLIPSPRLAPLYDVSSVLPWPHVNQFHAQNIAGKKRRPGDIAARHWNAIALAQGYRPADIRRRVQELADAIVAQKIAVITEVSALAGVSAGYVTEAADMIEANALRIAGRLRKPAM
ncbi:HipA domain-containing protein [Falsirhodobacter sp. alg1]|uniref:HipA domain-containing protein n=1 Tax=Falsirhodobacter sp. alg1 TaxID=1472418 RepID=UPI000693D52F|nr:HipA domain-containing protein [Falsirhodobacter sp. alg1]